VSLSSSTARETRHGGSRVEGEKSLSPDIDVRITEAAPKILEGLMTALEVRAADPHQRAMLHTYLSEVSWLANPPEGHARDDATPNVMLAETIQLIQSDTGRMECLEAVDAL